MKNKFIILLLFTIFSQNVLANNLNIQSKEIFVDKFDFSTDIPKVKTFHLDNTGMSIQATAAAIERYLATTTEKSLLS